ncbi:transmembrane protease serine 6-like [Acipenser oxyrinchus oxyrinchus]|uniref:Transmembrane protease serine 6-like n=1 Tax=Acipenser oxyrinchus oxyrinchus TaxID=40147 RepID=A0AAD8FS77_ACIOX|nr:transmembrane protease serine 6-like [Acipenser oxyrinchus oxyrinchus]
MTLDNKNIRKLKLLEPRVTQYYTVRFAINNRDFSLELTRRESTAFKTEASKVQDVLEKILKASDLSWYYNSTTVFAFGEGSLLCYCWLVLSVPQSLADRVTAGSVTDTLLQGVGGSGGSTTAYQQGEYIIERDSLNITGEAGEPDRKQHERTCLKQHWKVYKNIYIYFQAVCVLKQHYK